ncbi:type I toxin-antitoxin system SymE family toxin [Xenorhabdus budapestensis]|nr:type I toxin-antitoxin system SymE family toxin [Xenorhabdus budapestensis]
MRSPDAYDAYEEAGFTARQAVNITVEREQLIIRLVEKN